jgi:hypothetical protein
LTLADPTIEAVLYILDAAKRKARFRERRNSGAVMVQFPDSVWRLI